MADFAFEPPVKIATWNVNSLKVRLGHVLDWLSEAAPDVLALQETKLTDENFPLQAIEAAGYRALYAGQKTYNGVAVLSKRPAADPVRDIPQLDHPDRRILAATVDGVRIVNLYVVNGQAVGSEKYAFKLEWLDKVTRYLDDELARHDRLIVLGDFNIAPDDRDVHDPQSWHEKILVQHSGARGTADPARRGPSSRWTPERPVRFRALESSAEERGTRHGGNMHEQPKAPSTLHTA